MTMEYRRRGRACWRLREVVAPWPPQAVVAVAVAVGGVVLKDLSLRILPALLAARSFAVRAARWESRRTKMLGRCVLREPDWSLRPPNERRSVVTMLRQRRMTM